MVRAYRPQSRVDVMADVLKILALSPYTPRLPKFRREGRLPLRIDASQRRTVSRQSPRYSVTPSRDVRRVLPLRLAPCQRTDGRPQSSLCTVPKPCFTSSRARRHWHLSCGSSESTGHGADEVVSGIQHGFAKVRAEPAVEDCTIASISVRIVEGARCECSSASPGGWLCRRARARIDLPASPLSCPTHRSGETFS